MKSEKWITVTVSDPATGATLQISSRAGSCPNCGQSRCSKGSDLCVAVQKALKDGKFETFTM